MQLSLDRSNLPQTAAVAVMTVAALALLGYVLAYWGWVWLAPRPEPRTQAVADATGSGASAAGTLFGIAQADRSGSAPTQSSIRLLGIVAATPGRRGYAVVQLETKEILAVSQGDDIAPGIRLAEVAVDHVVLERGAIRETLAWPEKSMAPETAPMRLTR
jgi:general secretion pathway protein C